jgi:hypothetical protein
MGDIGEGQREWEFEPIEVPEETPEEVPAEVPEEVPA